MATTFQEDNGNTSMMRVMCFIAEMAAIACGLITLLSSGADKTVGLYLTGIFVCAAFAPKAVQKFLEQKIPK